MEAIGVEMLLCPLAVEENNVMSPIERICQLSIPAGVVPYDLVLKLTALRAKHRQHQF